MLISSGAARAVLDVLLLRESGYKMAPELVSRRLAFAIFFLYIYSQSLQEMQELKILGSSLLTLILSIIFEFPFEMGIIFVLAYFITEPSPRRKIIAREKYWRLFTLIALGSIPGIFSVVNGVFGLWSFACWVKAAALLSDFKKHRILQSAFAVIFAKAAVLMALYASVGFVTLTAMIFIDVIRERDIYIGSFWAVFYLFFIFPIFYGIYLAHKRVRKQKI